MEGQLGCLGNFIQRSKPYIAMICLQFGYAGMNIVTKVSLNRGMSHYVLVVYRHAFATAAIAPFALVLERYRHTYYLLHTLIDESCEVTIIIYSSHLHLITV